MNSAIPSCQDKEIFICAIKILYRLDVCTEYGGVDGAAGMPKALGG